MKQSIRKTLIASAALALAVCSAGQAFAAPAAIASSVASAAVSAEENADAYVPPKSSGYNAEKPGRIAYTADGNAHDQDDWAATPGSLSILAAAGLQGALVHYDYNDNTADHREVFPMSFTQEMRDSVANAVYYFGYDEQDLVGSTTDGVFYDVSLFEQNAIDHLASEIEKSTAEDPLYIILGGPAEILYQAMEKAEKGKEYVTVISHSQWNEWAEADGSWCKRGLKDGLHTLEQCGVTLENGNLIRIQDQNSKTVDGEKVPMLCITSDKTKDEQTWLDYAKLYSKAYWMKTAKNPGLNYMYQRLVDMTREEDDTDKCDMSDAGMMLYLLDGLQENDYTSLKKWYKAHDFLNADMRLDKSASQEDLKKDVQEVAYLDEAEVKVGDAVKAEDFPATVKVVLGDNKTTVEAAAKWAPISEGADFTDTGVYGKAGTYVYKATLELPDGYTNLKNTAAYKVVSVSE